MLLLKSNRDSLSDSSTIARSITSSKATPSKQNSRRTRTYKRLQTREKHIAQSRCVPSDESTDELEDFEPLPSHSNRKKCLSSKNDSPLPSEPKSKVSKPRSTFYSDGTTDDLGGDIEPDTRIEHEIKDDVFEDTHKTLIQFSSLPSPVALQNQLKEPLLPTCEEKLQSNSLLHAPHTNVQTIKNASIKGSSPLKLKKSSQKKRFLESKSSTEAHLSPIHDTTCTVSKTLLKQEAATDKQLPSSESAVQVLSVDELKDFENFSETTESDDVCLVEQKQQTYKNLPLKMDIEPHVEAQESYSKEKRDESIAKVRKWLESSSECSAVEVIQGDSELHATSQRDKASIHCTEAQPTLSLHRSTTEVNSDTVVESFHVKAQLEPVASIQEQGDIEIETKNKEESSGMMIGTFSEVSSNSTNSSLPAVTWKKEITENDETIISAPMHSQIEHVSVADVTHCQLTSISSPQQSFPSKAYHHLPDMQDASENEADKSHQQSTSKQVSALTTDSTVVEGNTSSRIKLKEVSIHLNRVGTAQKSPNKASMLEVTSGVSLEEMKLNQCSDMPTSKDDAGVEQTPFKHKLSFELKASEDLSHFVNSSRASDSLSVKNSSKEIGDLRKKKDPIPHSPKRQIKLTDVPGMTYSARKAVLKTNIESRLPSPSTTVQRTALPRTQSCATAEGLSERKGSSSPSCRSNVDIQLSSSPCLQRQVQVNQSSNSTTSKSFQRPKVSNIIQQPHLESSSHSFTSFRGSKDARVYTLTSSALTHHPKMQPGDISGSRSSLSLETRQLLDNVGQSVTSTDDRKSIPMCKQHASVITSTITKRHIPLKPRILPKADDLLVEVLSWDAGAFLSPKQTDNGKLIQPMIRLKEEPLKVPKAFESFDHYFNTFKPLVFLELSTMVSNISVFLPISNIMNWLRNRYALTHECLFYFRYSVIFTLQTIQNPDH